MFLALTNGTLAYMMQKEIWKALECWGLISCCFWNLETIIGSKPKLGREKKLMSFLQGEKTKHPSWQPALNLVLNSELGRQTQAEVPSLIPLPILSLLPLYPHPLYSAYTESTLFPVPQRKRRSWEGADTFLTLGHPQTWWQSPPVDTPTPSLFLFLLRCPYNGLFVTFNFPKTLLPLFQRLSRAYKGWKKLHCYTLSLRGK